ncbi:LIF receptor subunit alpha a [Anguilla anguilla]|uniref:LIF receptor subunit alpha a n=1 Tax=Anguilla anguilla TaxID=7936 RepID=UPI0015A97863|nr:LIF receptor subunit alpha a [Anguilla anguilla]XP_035234453.1 LIF receptor subunit alpha a [Anguilla anguilla]XP_035234454.1 LIF receptor subunit alpha a [Anguilla anguilla]
MIRWLLWALLVALHTGVSRSQDGLQPPVPQGVRVEPDFGSQVLSISWEKNPASPKLMYDVQVLRTELMEVVYNETMEVRPDSPGKVHHFNWTSGVPLECTSHSVRLRSRDQQRSSDWSPLQTVPGMDIPDNPDAKMYPQDLVVLVGSNMTFCCIMEEGKQFGSFKYLRGPLASVRLSRRSYAGTMTNQLPSMPSGTNVLCMDDNKGLGSGAVVFVGYPPGDGNLTCETRDLRSVECQWSAGRETHLRGVRQTFYTLNGRNCTSANELARSGRRDKLQCRLNATLEGGSRVFTLEARNPLGTIHLSDTADLSQRVRPYAPLKVVATETRGRNSSLRWDWGTKGYEALLLECQASVNGSERAFTLEYAGQGLKQAVVTGLEPDEEYSVRIRCRLQSAPWRWGDWSHDYTFRTEEERPDALDAWAWMATNQTGYIKWKPLSKSHGQILGYRVTYGRPEEEYWQTLSLPQTKHSALLRLGPDGDYIITVIAHNSAGESPPASVTVPQFIAGETEGAVPTVRVAGSAGGFDLSLPADANASCGYVVEWCHAGRADCDWAKVSAGNASARIESESFEAGVRYNFSIYACTDRAPELLARREGYVQELVPAQPVSSLMVEQYKRTSGALLSWGDIPLESRRGFISGYSIYRAIGTHLMPIANLTNPDARNYTVRNLTPGLYKFTVKAHTSAGSDEGATVSLNLDLTTDWLVGEVLIALGAMTAFLILMTVVCYEKRQWVKKTFYPEIPEPKLQEEWSTTPGPFGGRTLDVQPCPHSTVHIVEDPGHGSGKPDPTEDGEEDEESGDSSSDTDSCDPVVLRYYNQVVDEGSRCPPSTDSSASSMASARTDVTYTGIQSPAPCTSSSSSASAAAAGVTQPEVPHTGGYRPQMAPAPEPAEPQQDCAEPAEPTDLPLLGGFGGFGGYQPQSTWRAPTPETRSLNSSLGSPTSVSSSQFLLPDPEAEEGGERAPSTTWFHSLLSGKP